MTTQVERLARQDNMATLSDGRMLGYAEYGDPEGKPVFFFHGLPGSRIFPGLWHEEALARGVRVIAPDRPGFGLSSFQNQRRITSWPSDVSALAQQLGIERFAVAGMSGGGPYAAACAHALEGRLTGAAIISGVGPLDRIPHATKGMMTANRVLFGVSRRIPPAGAALIALYARMMKRANEERLLSRISKSMPTADRAIMERKGVASVFLADIKEAFRSGSRGPAHDNALVVRGWGFRLDEITCHVHVWQGGADRNVPASHGRYQAEAIPNATLHFYPDEGHLLVVDHIGEILNAVV